MAEQSNDQQIIQQLTVEKKALSATVVRLKARLLESEQSCDETILAVQSQLEDYENKFKAYATREREIAQKEAALEEKQAEWDRKEQEYQSTKEGLENLQGVVERLHEAHEADLSIQLHQLKSKVKRLEIGVKERDEKIETLQDIEFKNVSLGVTVEELRGRLLEKDKEIAVLKREVEPLRAALQRTLKMNISANKDMLIDKRVITKMLISYLTKPAQRQEIIDLMSSMLNFTDEEKQQVGLAAQVNDGGWYGYFTGAPTTNSSDKKEEDPLEGVSLADLWIKFLEKEAEADNA